MTTTMLCDRCGRKPRARGAATGWAMVRVYRHATPDIVAREFDLCEECVAIFNEAVSKPRRSKPKSVVPLRVVQSS